MKPDLTNEQGIAALFVATQGRSHTMNYMLCTDGTGLHVENHSAAGAWRSFTALPAGIDIAEVAFWTPLTMYTVGGVWYLRGDALDAWETAATGGEDRPETVPARDPKVQITIV
jgi:hypothetical protein